MQPVSLPLFRLPDPVMGHVFRITLLLWLAGWMDSSHGVPTTGHSSQGPSHIWDGSCGKPTPSGAQWLKINPVFKSNSNPAALMQSLEGHLVGTPDDIARSMPWHMAIWVSEMTIGANLRMVPSASYAGAAALIRARPGIDESDFAITDGYTCSKIRHSLRNWQYGHLPDPPRAVFGAYDLRTNGFPTIPIKDCYHSDEYSYDTGADRDGDKRAFGIIQLADRIPFTGQARPVCMPQAERISVGADVAIGAWGLPDDETKPASLRRIRLRVVDRSHCRNQSLHDHSDHEFCVGTDGLETVGIVVAGGPVLRQRDDGAFVMIGIANLNTADYSSLDNQATSVHYFIRNGWIEDMIRRMQARE